MVFTKVQILSAVARVSGGTYGPILKRTRQWRENGSFSRENKQRFLKEYVTPLLRCGKPSQIEEERWFLKCLSNDQTAFTGFTSLVDVVEDDRLGYNSQIRALPMTVFIEQFVFSRLMEQDQRPMLDLCDRLNRRDSTEILDINEILLRAEDLTTRARLGAERRTKGKTPLFFYSVTDQPFLLPASLYKRMVEATQIAVDGISDVASRFEGSLEEALFGSKQRKRERQLFTGSIDFMVCDDTIYLIDIGSPAVGYVSDIVWGSRGVERTWDFGLDALAQAAGEEATIYRKNADELGFFRFENDLLINGLRRKGVKVTEQEGSEGEVAINGKVYPTPAYDYLTRNQPLRNRILEAMSSRLGELGVKIPRSVVTIPERGDLSSAYEQMRMGDDYGMMVKKKVFFKEYDGFGTGYFKPLVMPLWSSEVNNDARRSTLFEQFIPALVDVDVAGDCQGKRSYEIRLYYCVEGER